MRSAEISVVPPRPVAPPPPAAVALPASPADPLVALDPEIKRGTLANGLTYYVMKHKKPEQRVALWLVVNAGSVLEDDDQRGLAHFVEHMAFNGTRRFPRQAIVDYIEKAGIRFGADLNARTSFDETVYQLTVPNDNHEALMTGLDILRDWAGDVSFDPVEVDKERGVVLEEWRLGRGPFARINDWQWPVMFQSSRYAERLPIGLPETIKGAPRDKLVRFYRDWYRPHNMAVIAIGDFDLAEIEHAIAGAVRRSRRAGAPAGPRADAARSRARGGDRYRSRDAGWCRSSRPTRASGTRRRCGSSSRRSPATSSMTRRCRAGNGGDPRCRRGRCAGGRASYAAPTTTTTTSRAASTSTRSSGG